MKNTTNPGGHARRGNASDQRPHCVHHVHLPMNLLRQLGSAAAITAVLLTAGNANALDVQRARELATQNACLGCHSVTSRMVGPSYQEVGEKYKGMDPVKLAARIKSGGSGHWGALEMPPQTALSDADARLLAEWVLAGSPEK
ncbi:c-type cytochrome [Cupriavidus pinatubonensis]|nr:c-type cytochrome [Cupriavidus pinatubonensis]